MPLNDPSFDNDDFMAMEVSLTLADLISKSVRTPDDKNELMRAVIDLPDPVRVLLLATVVGMLGELIRHGRLDHDDFKAIR